MTGLTRAALVTALWWAAVACTPAVDDDAPVATVPVGLEDAEPAVRLDLERRYRDVAEAIESGSLDGPALGHRFGDLGISLLGNNFYAEAAALFDRARTLAPSDFRWHYYFGHAARRTGDMEAASAGFGAAREVEPSSLPATLWWAETRLHREALDEAEAAFEAALDADPHCAQAMTGLGRIALSRGDYDLAVERLRGALERRPDSPPARYALALALRGSGDVDAARRELDALDGENHSLTITCFEDPWIQESKRRSIGTRGHESRAIRAREGGLPATALVELRAAVRANPNRYPARYDIAALLLQLGRRDEALEELDELLELRPDYALALALRSRLTAEDGDLERADALMQRAAAADPQDESIHRMRGDLLMATGRAGGALAAYDAALAVNSAYEEAILGRAGALAAIGRTDEAARWMSEQQRTYPTRLAIALAEIELRLGGPDDDRDELVARARELNAPPNLQTASTLAATLAFAGDFRGAVAWQAAVLDALPASRGWSDTRRAATSRLDLYQRRRTPSLQTRLEALSLGPLYDLAVDPPPEPTDGTASTSKGT